MCALMCPLPKYEYSEFIGKSDAKMTNIISDEHRIKFKQGTPQKTCVSEVQVRSCGNINPVIPKDVFDMFEGD